MSLADELTLISLTLKTLLAEIAAIGRQLDRRFSSALAERHRFLHSRLRQIQVRRDQLLRVRAVA